MCLRASRLKVGRSARPARLGHGPRGWSGARPRPHQRKVPSEPGYPFRFSPPTRRCRAYGAWAGVLGCPATSMPLRWSLGISMISRISSYSDAAPTALPTARRNAAGEIAAPKAVGFSFVPQVQSVPPARNARPCSCLLPRGEGIALGIHMGLAVQPPNAVLSTDALCPQRVARLCGSAGVCGNGRNTATVQPSPGNCFFFEGAGSGPRILRAKR
jgi:hypothetical protein